MANDTNVPVRSGTTEEHEIERTRQDRPLVPLVDIIEGPDTLLLIAELPGVDENSVAIDIEKNVLTISGRMKLPERGDGYQQILEEFEVGAYHRSFTLSNEVDQGKIEAQLKDGLLRLHLPKAQEAQPRKIAVKVG